MLCINGYRQMQFAAEWSPCNIPDEIWRERWSDIIDVITATPAVLTEQLQNIGGNLIGE
ncbi:MAG: hypothetical protein HJJLKODD_00219 [Phycisphaerae bacterium]|nr:hypothetical protein [Phycisphaerae bacterium]